jgi:thiol-disulfide isomerase/thioredoxin
MSGGVWIASYVLLWVAVVVLGLAVVVLLRQIGVLHARLLPTGVHPANEGPAPDTPAPFVAGVDWTGADLTLLAFTSPTCTLCAALTPSLSALDRAYPDVAVRVVSHADDAATFRAFNVRSTPYVVAVDATGTVRGGGVANTLEQVEALVEATR